MLADIWQSLLKVKHPGIYDNFFELGGHSLLMAQLAAQIRTAFQVHLSLRALFQSPTLEEMGITIREEMLKQADGETHVEVLPRPRNAQPYVQFEPESLYHLIKVEAGPETVDRKLNCQACGAPLPARDGQFVLKYFLLRKPSRR